MSEGGEVDKIAPEHFTLLPGHKIKLGEALNSIPENLLDKFNSLQIKTIKEELSKDKANDEVDVPTGFLVDLFSLDHLVHPEIQNAQYYMADALYDEIRNNASRIITPLSFLDHFSKRVGQGQNTNIEMAMGNGNEDEGKRKIKEKVEAAKDMTLQISDKLAVLGRLSKYFTNISKSNAHKHSDFFRKITTGDDSVRSVVENSKKVYEQFINEKGEVFGAYLGK